MLVTSTNSALVETVGLYIHSVMTTWPGVAAAAGLARATGTRLRAPSVIRAARARTRVVIMTSLSNQARCTTTRAQVNERGTRRERSVRRVLPVRIERVTASWTVASEGRRIRCVLPSPPEVPMVALPFDDTTDFDDAAEGLRRQDGPVRRARRERSGDLGQRRLRVPRRRLSRHREPEPVAPGPAVREAGPVRGHRRHLPGAGPRPLEHDAGRGRRGRHRHRPADLEGDRGRRAGAVPRAPRRPAGHRGDLHARARRPLRRRARRVPRRGADRRRARVHGGRGRRERLRRRRHEPPGRVHVRRHAREGPGRPDRRRPRADHVDSARSA